ncbi:MAG TPA: GntR family transcriptional regulator [Solirubrobacteraceae bacterium]|nr:GntR family transcriptional regulator [Solirubrobacteraceae bacterium]
MTLRAIENRSLADEVFGQLLGELIGERWAPGDRLPAERVLSATFGVNRHVVREALGRLEQLGLVRIVQGGGTQVLDPRRSAGLDLLAALAEHAAAVEAPLGPLRAALEMRAGIGSDVARLCAQRAGPELHPALQTACDDLAASPGGVVVLALDERFWRLVLEGADNFAYELAFNSLIRGVHALPRVSVPWLEHELAAGRYRRPIADAITAGDPDGAAQAARQALAPAAEAFTVLASAAPSPPREQESGP